MINVSPHGSKDDVIGKNRRSRSLKRTISQCSRLFPWLPIVPMDLAWNFRGTLTRKLSFCSKWKSLKVTGFLHHTGSYLGQTSTSESYLLGPNGLGTWRELPQGKGKLDGRSWSSILTDFYGFWLFPGEDAL